MSLAAFDTTEAGVDLNRELGAGVPLAEHLLLLKELGVEESGPAGCNALIFTWLQRIGSRSTVINVSAWFEWSQARAGQSGVLEPADAGTRAARDAAAQARQGGRNYRQGYDRLPILRGSPS